MAVIYLPQDPRTALLGQGLGALAGNIANAWAQRSINQGVQTILSDESIPKEQKFGTIAARYGKPGTDALGDILKSQLLQQQIATSGATATQLGAETRAKNLASDIAAQTAPATVQEAYAKARTEQERAPLVRAQAAAEAMRPAMLQEQTGLISAERTRTERQTAGIDIENQLKQGQLTLTQALTQQPTVIDDILGRQGITDPQQVARVKAAAPLGAAEMFKEIDKVQAERNQAASQERAAAIRANEPRDLNPRTAQQVVQTSQLRASSEAFLRALQADPSTGMASGAPLRAVLMHYGVSNPDPSFMDLYENQLQMVRASAESGNGFGGQWRINVGRDVSPTVAKTPVANIVSLDVIADREIAGLQAAKKNIALNERQTGLDDEIEGWKKIKTFTNSIRDTYVDKNGRTVLMLGGNVIGTDLKPTFEGGSTVYNLSHPGKAVKEGDISTVGARIIGEARARGLNPLDYYQQLLSHTSGSQP